MMYYVYEYFNNKYYDLCVMSKVENQTYTVILDINNFLDFTS